MEGKNYPLGDSMGQIDHQTSYTENGSIVDKDERLDAEYNSNGSLIIIDEDEAQLMKYIKEAISISNFIETFNENAHETLLKLLALQDNKNPLKKGGAGIAYRTDVLIMHCKMAFSADENIVFDAILGMMSSYPDNKSYKISPSFFQQYSKYADDKYLYKIFKNGAKKLKDKHLSFDLEEDDDFCIPWYSILRYHGSKKDDANAYIEFVPTDFFKDLALCSQIVHGAYGSLEVITQLQGKYTIALYWFLESKKNYREYPNAQPGVFRISLEDLKYQFSMPESYKANDIRRRALDPAKESINSINECDFTFDFKEHKANGVIAGFQFTIMPKKYIESKIVEERQIDDSLYTQIETFLDASAFDFSKEDVKKIYEQAKKNDRDAMFMMEVIIAFKQRLSDKQLEPVEDNAKVSYLCKMIERGFKKQNNKYNHPQSDIDFDELEKKLVDN